jgi:hypothetical protein
MRLIRRGRSRYRTASGVGLLGSVGQTVDPNTNRLGQGNEVGTALDGDEKSSIYVHGPSQASNITTGYRRAYVSGAVVVGAVVIMPEEETEEEVAAAAASRAAKWKAILAFFIRGNEFEDAVIAAVKGTPNSNFMYWTSETGEVIKTKPDILTSTTMTEIKDCKTLSFSKQLKAQLGLAKETGRSFTLIINMKTTLTGRKSSRLMFFRVPLRQLCGVVSLLDLVD